MGKHPAPDRTKTFPHPREDRTSDKTVHTVPSVVELDSHKYLHLPTDFHDVPFSRILKFSNSPTESVDGPSNSMHTVPKGTKSLAEMDNIHLYAMNIAPKAVRLLGFAGCNKTGHAVNQIRAHRTPVAGADSSQKSHLDFNWSKARQLRSRTNMSSSSHHDRSIPAWSTRTSSNSITASSRSEQYSGALSGTTSMNVEYGLQFRANDTSLPPVQKPVDSPQQRQQVKGRTARGRGEAGGGEGEKKRDAFQTILNKPLPLMPYEYKCCTTESASHYQITELESFASISNRSQASSTEPLRVVDGTQKQIARIRHISGPSVVDPTDEAIRQLVQNMGYSESKAKLALAMSDSGTGTDLRKAIEILSSRALGGEQKPIEKLAIFSSTTNFMSIPGRCRSEGCHELHCEPSPASKPLLDAESERGQICDLSITKQTQSKVKPFDETGGMQSRMIMDKEDGNDAVDITAARIRLETKSTERQVSAPATTTRPAQEMAESDHNPLLPNPLKLRQTTPERSIAQSYIELITPLTSLTSTTEESPSTCSVHSQFSFDRLVPRTSLATTEGFDSPSSLYSDVDIKAWPTPGAHAIESPKPQEWSWI